MRRESLAWGWALALWAVGVLGVLLGVLAGSQGLEWAAVPAWAHDPVLQHIVQDIRLPRSLGAWLGGALLGLAGAVAQGLFRNPLADPYVLGSASGASLGVSLYVVGSGTAALGAGAWQRMGMTGAAFVGAFLAVGLTLALARGGLHSVRLLLAGVVVGVVLGAAASLVALFDPQVWQVMQGFMLGSTAWVGWSACALMAAVLCASLCAATGVARVLDALSLGDTTAASLGLPLAQARWLLVCVLAGATGAAVAQMGLMAFVGLAAPHAVRSLVRVRHAAHVGLSALMGGALLLWADVVARVAWAPQELPVGALTAVLGGAYLLWRMHRKAGASA